MPGEARNKNSPQGFEVKSTHARTHTYYIFPLPLSNFSHEQGNGKSSRWCLEFKHGKNGRLFKLTRLNSDDRKETSNIKNRFSFHLEYLKTNFIWISISSMIIPICVTNIINIRFSHKPESLLQFGINSFVAFIKHWTRFMRQVASNCENNYPAFCSRFISRPISYKDINFQDWFD